MLLDGLAAELPTATLRSGSRHSRRRVISGHLVHWVVNRWAWLRPRTLPMIAGFVGMLAVLGATRYLSAYARGDQRRATVIYSERPSTRPSPGQIRIAPVRPGHHNVTITLTP